MSPFPKYVLGSHLLPPDVANCGPQSVAPENSGDSHPVLVTWPSWGPMCGGERTK